MSTDQFTPPAMPAGLTPKQQQEFLRKHAIAHNFNHKSTGSYLYATASAIVGPNGSPESFVLYLDQLLEEAGDPKDPIEKMLIEQIALAHHAIGSLYVRAASADSLEKTKAFFAAVTGLLGEFRRATLALKKYREPTPTKNVVLVGQQNIAQNQQVGYGDAGQQECKKNTSRNELANKNQEAITHEPPIDVIPQPQTRGSRQTEPTETRPTHAGRSRTIAGSGASRQALDALDRPQNGSR